MNNLIDTDITALFFDESRLSQYQRIRSKVNELNDQDNIYASALTLYEFEYSYANAPEPKKQNLRNTIVSITDHFVVIPLHQSFASTYGKLKAFLKQRSGRSTKEMSRYNIDLMIAATAIDRDCKLVSNDGLFTELSSFNKDLLVKKWIASDTTEHC